MVAIYIGKPATGNLPQFFPGGRRALIRNPLRVGYSTCSRNAGNASLTLNRQRPSAAGALVLAETRAEMPMPIPRSFLSMLIPNRRGVGKKQSPILSPP